MKKKLRCRRVFRRSSSSTWPLSAELAQVKAVWGELKSSNLSLQTNNSLFYSLNKKPYVEAGLGVENIFRIIRVDFLWRMSYLENPNISKFGFRGSLQLTF